MMKRNQELDKAYTSFIGDLKLLVEQSRDFSTSYKKQLKEIDKEFKKKQINIELNLGKSSYSFEILTCDISSEYIRMNSDYRS